MVENNHMELKSLNPKRSIKKDIYQSTPNATQYVITEGAHHCALTVTDEDLANIPACAAQFVRGLEDCLDVYIRSQEAKSTNTSAPRDTSIIEDPERYPDGSYGDFEVRRPNGPGSYPVIVSRSTNR